MKKNIISAMLISTIILSVIGTRARGKEQTDVYKNIMKQDLLCLMMAYPDHIVNINKEENGLIYVVMKSGKKIIYDDKRAKGFEEKLNNPDLQDMLEQVYPLEPIEKVLDKNFDPGRIRVYPLLHEVYGVSRETIEKNLKPSKAGLNFNSMNGALDSLNVVINGFKEVCKYNGKAAAAIYPLNGTYNYRIISGTGRLSPHAFGIAIDLARDPRDYWQWANIEQGNSRIKGYPKELPKLFEDNNFIWGGKWNHFDILHYEYRPEIILKARYFGRQQEKEESWYKGAPLDDLKVKEYIQLIDKTLD